MSQDLNKLSLNQLKVIAKDRGFSGKDASRYGAVQKKSTWIELLTLNPGKKVKGTNVSSLKTNSYKTSKKRVVYGLKRLS